MNLRTIHNLILIQSRRSVILISGMGGLVVRLHTCYQYRRLICNFGTLMLGSSSPYMLPLSAPGSSTLISPPLLDGGGWLCIMVAAEAPGSVLWRRDESTWLGSWWFWQQSKYWCWDWHGSLSCRSHTPTSGSRFGLFKQDWWLPALG